VTQTVQPADGSAGAPELAWEAPAVSALALADGRHIELHGLMNLRDVGGYPLPGGGRIRWRTLFRSDAPGHVDAAGADVLAGLGLRTVVDLRTDSETEAAPTALGLPARTTQISLLGADLQALPPELPAIYRYLVDDRGAVIAAAIGLLAGPGAFPALVHCSAGKDRTGVVTALVLSLAGVPDEYIAADYALTARYLDLRRTAAIGRIQASTGLAGELAEGLLLSPPALILETLDRVRQTAGSVEGYLRRHGLSQSDLDRLRASLTE
jgi:protein-tyrosine phosphatase